MGALATVQRPLTTSMISMRPVSNSTENIETELVTILLGLRTAGLK
jgi:hypothetical protein